MSSEEGSSERCGIVRFWIWMRSRLGREERQRRQRALERPQYLQINGARGGPATFVASRSIDDDFNVGGYWQRRQNNSDITAPVTAARNPLPPLTTTATATTRQQQQHQQPQPPVAPPLPPMRHQAVPPPVQTPRKRFLDPSPEVMVKIKTALEKEAEADVKTEKQPSVIPEGEVSPEVCDKCKPVKKGVTLAQDVTSTTTGSRRSKKSHRNSNTD